ncbi:MAG: hypothetical protein COA79_19065 [Planctomycetota bacterium]|nr:MAG: hypothetical protein COA79_19065 [Planctomycetota bacterium]
MKEYDKKMTASNSDEKKLKMMKMFRGMTLFALKNTVIEIKLDGVTTYQVNKDTVVAGKFIVKNSGLIIFKPDEDKKKKGNSIIKKLVKESIELKQGKNTLILAKMNTKDAKAKIAEIKSKKK